MTDRPLDPADVRRTRALVLALEMTALDPDAPGLATNLEDVYAHHGIDHDLIGDEFAAVEIRRAWLVLEAMQRHLDERRPLVVPDDVRAGWRACAVPGCGELALLHHCTGHELEAIERKHP